MRLLLDTHAFLWWLGDDPKLGAGARERVGSPDSIVHVSAASIWELSLKEALGRIDLGGADLVAEIAANDFVALPISVAHAVAAGGLPRHHDDPFDRMLIAQGQMENLVLVTHDPAFQRYDIATLST